MWFDSDSCPCGPTEQSQDSLQRFEHQAGLTDDVYSPHKGLSAEETRSARLVDGTVPVSLEINHSSTTLSFRLLAWRAKWWSVAGCVGKSTHRAY